MTELREIFESYPNITVAKLATATGVSYAMVLAKSRQPIEGAVYDPKVINTAALDKLMERHNVDLDKIDWEKVAAEAVKTSTAKLKITEFAAGDRFTVKYFKADFTVVYATKEYVCILADGATQPKVLSYSTFNACGLTKLA